jgi:NADH pyrophosphatase NudC (nudix superfamily)
VQELGTLVAEMERLGRRNDDLVKRKAHEIVTLNQELEGLRGALGERLTLERVVAAGIAGSCSSCGSLLGTEDRFCSHCGTPAGAQPNGAASSNGAHPQTDGAGAQRA